VSTGEGEGRSERRCGGQHGAAVLGKRDGWRGGGFPPQAEEEGGCGRQRGCRPGFLRRQGGAVLCPRALLGTSSRGEFG